MLTKVDQLLVVEELEPFFEDAIKAMGIPCSGKDKTGLQGELFVRKVGRLFGGEADCGPAETQGVPMRPPVLCPGCPHRAVFYVLKKLRPDRRGGYRLLHAGRNALRWPRWILWYAWARPSAWRWVWKRRAAVTLRKRPSP